MASRPKLVVNIRERDLGLGHILREVAKLRKKPYVKVGVTQKRGSKLHVVENEDGTTSPGPKTVADIAQIHEYGGENFNPPERSFIRSTVYKNQSKYGKHIAQLKDQILDANSGVTTERALGILGEEVSSDIRNTIRAGINPPLAASTRRRKNAGEIAKAKAHLSGRPSAKDFTQAGATRNAKALALVSTGGASVPLIDTAQMIRAISYERVESGSETKGVDGDNAGGQA